MRHLFLTAAILLVAVTAQAQSGPANKEFETANGVTAHGGAIDGPGPVIADGMVM